MSTASLIDAPEPATMPLSGMQPVSFHGCFGWLHPAAHAVAWRVPVILCQATNMEGALAHRPFRLMAESLAKAGHPTLRFDYPGTGDSCDNNTTEWWNAALQSVHAAADWLKDHTGLTHLVLCGLRFGAMAAAVAAGQRDDIAGLIMLAPILRGRSFIRQLSIEARLPMPASASHGLAAGGLQLTADTVGSINQVDLRLVVPRSGCRAVVYAPSESQILLECVENWRKFGVQVTCQDFSGLEPILSPATLSYEVPADTERIVAWLRTSLPAAFQPPVMSRRLEKAELQPTGCIEAPLRFGADGKLFGVLCRPAAQTDTRIAVIITNSGGLPHYGCGRFGVYLARQLAAHGIASLRMDFAGLGDSVAPGDASTHQFETDRRLDIQAAIATLHDLGFRKFAVQGVCSGAFHSFHSALVDPRISLLLLVNMPLFQWVPEAPKISTHWQKLTARKYWKQLLRGRLNIRGRIFAQAVWLRAKWQQVTERAREWLRPGEQRRNFPLESMRRISQRANTLFLLSEGDESVDAITGVFPANDVPRGVTIRVEPGLSHSLEERNMQVIAGNIMIDFVMRHLSDEPSVTA